MSMFQKGDEYFLLSSFRVGNKHFITIWYLQCVCSNTLQLCDAAYTEILPPQVHVFITASFHQM